MLNNDLKTALRYFRKHKVYAVINFTGLTVGLACCLLMLLYVIHELSYDRYHPGAERIYRIAANLEARGASSQNATLPALPSPEDELPEIEHSCRLFSYSWREKALVARDDLAFYEDRFFLAEPAILDIFAIDFIHGDPHASLDDPGRILLSQSAAGKLFPDGNALGERISVRNMGQADFVVTGIFRDMPDASHFHADYIAPLSAGKNLFWKGFLQRNSSWVYIRLAPEASPANLESRLPAYFEKHLGDNARFYVPFLQPLTDIHLRSHLSDEIEPNSDIKFIYLFSFLALVILLAAGFNYVNLATARSAERALEVGLRKVVGAERRQLAAQFIGEAVITSFLTLAPALLLIEILLPAFNVIVQRRLSLDIDTIPVLLPVATGAALLTGLLAGIYPALVLSAPRPIQIFRGRARTGASRSGFRAGLVIAQSTISVGLIIGTLAVTGQMRFMSRRNLGFQTEHVVTIPMKDSETTGKYGVIRTAFLKSPMVRAVTASQSPLFDTRLHHHLWYEGLEDDTEIEVVWNAVDYDILDTYGIELVSGRGFSPDIASDDKDAYLINESAARAFGWSEALGRRLNLSNRGLKNPVFGPGRVIGVVKDFHHRSLHESIEPLVMNVYQEQFREIAVRIDGQGLEEALDFMRAEWRRILPGRSMEVAFLDNRVDALYREDRRTNAVLVYSTGLSLFVACLGLFGLAAFTAARRRKEIGIRKVMGATTRGIVVLLSRDFIRLVLIANAIAWPVAWLVAHRWLEDYAYHIHLSGWIFGLALAASLIVSLLAVGFQALRAALSSPVKEIRYE